jgi:hypothetical protein
MGWNGGMEQLKVSRNEQPHVIDILKSLPGYKLFHTAEEVDSYMRKERDSWEHQSYLQKVKSTCPLGQNPKHLAKSQI